VLGADVDDHVVLADIEDRCLADLPTSWARIVPLISQPFAQALTSLWTLLAAL
jgi:hypothetical protein